MTDRITAAYNVQQAALRRRSADTLARLFRALGTYESTEPWLTLASPLVAASTSASASLASSWISLLLDVAPIELSARATSPYQFTERYSNSLHAMWQRLGEGASQGEAIEAGAVRATALVDMDAQWSGTRAAREQGRAAGVKRWRRVPESGACATCLAAAANTYKSADLKPIHRGCGCWVEPIT